MVNSKSTQTLKSGKTILFQSVTKVRMLFLIFEPGVFSVHPNPTRTKTEITFIKHLSNPRRHWDFRGQTSYSKVSSEVSIRAADSANEPSAFDLHRPAKATGGDSAGLLPLHWPFKNLLLSPRPSRARRRNRKALGTPRSQAWRPPGPPGWLLRRPCPPNSWVSCGSCHSPQDLGELLPPPPPGATRRLSARTSKWDNILCEGPPYRGEVDWVASASRPSVRVRVVLEGVATCASEERGALASEKRCGHQSERGHPV